MFAEHWELVSNESPFRLGWVLPQPSPQVRGPDSSDGACLFPAAEKFSCWLPAPRSALSSGHAVCVWTWNIHGVGSEGGWREIPRLAVAAARGKRSPQSHSVWKPKDGQKTAHQTQNSGSLVLGSVKGRLPALCQRRPQAQQAAACGFSRLTHSSVGWEQSTGARPYLESEAEAGAWTKKGTKTHPLNHSCGERREDGVSQAPSPRRAACL